jgi:regulator of protease activity HflC (stomatin/prohibitin superfamily)
MGLKTKLILIAVGLVLLLSSLGIGCERIDAGSVGIKVNMTGGTQGIAKTEYVTGWCFYWRLAQKVYEFPTYQQHKEYDPYEVPAKGGTMFTVHPTFNYNLNAGEVGNMFQRYRLGLSTLENGFIKNSMTTAIREVTNTFTADSILNNQAGYDAAIYNKLNKELAPYFQVTQFTANLIPDPNLKASIINKAKAVQDAQAAIAQQSVTRANAEIDIINAKKDSVVTMTAALAEANSMRAKNEALKESPQLVEYTKALKWNGVLPSTIMGGSGAVPFFNINKQ